MVMRPTGDSSDDKTNDDDDEDDDDGAEDADEEDEKLLMPGVAGEFNNASVDGAEDDGAGEYVKVQDSAQLPGAAPTSSYATIRYAHPKQVGGTNRKTSLTHVADGLPANELNLALPTTGADGLLNSGRHTISSAYERGNTSGSRFPISNLAFSPPSKF